jgi:hypothetical protein
MYSNFTFTELKRRFGLDQENDYIFEGQTIKPVEATNILLNELAEGRQMPIYSEKAKSEFLIGPIIKEIKRKNPHLSIFSGYTFNVDRKNKLTGAPDFLISNKPDKIDIESPVFCLMESKNKTPDEGYAQCAAEMYAARIFNQNSGEPHDIIFGAVTNAFEWVFMKLEGTTVYIDKERYFINELPRLLGVLQHAIDHVDKP